MATAVPRSAGLCLNVSSSLLLKLCQERLNSQSRSMTSIRTRVKWRDIPVWNLKPVRRMVKEGDLVKPGELLVRQAWMNRRYYPGFFVRHSENGCLISTVEGMVRYRKEPIETYMSLLIKNLKLVKDGVNMVHIIPTTCPLKLELTGFRTYDDKGNVVFKSVE